MHQMEEKILKDGQVLPGGILKVGSFLNQQIDTAFLREIGEEIARLYDGSGVTKIGARAFADCPKLQHIEILGPDTWIDPTSFAGVSELTIHGADGSYAEFYASKYGFNFIAE